MKSCGGCTACCKTPKIKELNKPANQWCRHCAIGTGCTIYDRRPKVCKDFVCRWLTSDMVDAARPDRIGFYVTTESDIAKVHVDIDRAEAWRNSSVIEDLRERFHVVVLVGNQVTFLQGRGLPALEKILLDWAV